MSKKEQNSSEHHSYLVFFFLVVDDVAALPFDLVQLLSQKKIENGMVGKKRKDFAIFLLAQKRRVTLGKK